MPMWIAGRWMKIFVFAAMGAMMCATAFADDTEISTQERNKALARAFYEDLWFSQNTDRYSLYMADTYVAHDIGDRKNVTEPAIEQKHIADFFWANGEMSGEINYQVAEGDLVATRWIWRYEPTTFLGRLLLGRDDLPIINVLRFEDGKIVELWNHRHDIDTGMPLRFTLKGFLYGVLLALLPLAWAISLRRRLKRVQEEASA